MNPAFTSRDGAPLIDVDDGSAVLALARDYFGRCHGLLRRPRGLQSNIADRAETLPGQDVGARFERVAALGPR